jgi:hypothetical protein
MRLNNGAALSQRNLEDEMYHADEGKDEDRTRALKEPEADDTPEPRPFDFGAQVRITLDEMKLSRQRLK